MKRFIILSSLLAAASLANAQDNAPQTGIFLAAGPAVGYFGEDFDTSVGGSITLGYQLPNEQSIEFEAGFFDSSLDESWVAFDAKFTPLLGKYRVPFALNQNLSISVAGVTGALIEKIESGYYTRKDTAFVIGAEVGIEYKITKAFNLNAGVTALYATETDITTDGGISLFNFRASYRF